MVEKNVSPICQKNIKLMRYMPGREGERDVKTENLLMHRPFLCHRKRQNREKELCSHKKSLKKKK